VPATDVAYLAQHGLFEQLSGLAEDIDVPLYAGHDVGSVNAWFGTAGTVTRCHFDSYDNLLTQVVGYKFVRLYAPADSKNLYAMDGGASKVGAGDAASADADGASPGSQGKHTSGKPQGDVTTSQRNISAVDVERADLERFPLFAHARHYDTVLGPGDMLFIPHGWWHYVRALTVSMSINFWW
jgi:hypothetical protein